MGQNRRDLRRLVGQGLGDCVVLVATDDGTDQAFVDDDNLDGPNNAYKGYDLYLVDGTNANIGLRRRIDSSIQATGRVTWAKPLPANTQEGDEAELWNTRGIGIRATEVNDALNAALVFASKQTLIPVEAEIADVFDADDPRLVVPSRITRGMFGVVWTDDNGVIRTVDRADGEGEYGWYYEDGSRRIVIGGSEYLAAMDGLTVTIRGVGEPDPMLTDRDETEIDPEWIVAEATRRMIAGLRMRNPDAERWLPPAWQEANQKRPLASGRGIANLVVFR